ncbi:MAG TPA: hypothetical protein VJH65_01910 [Candidatus Nanoarchaeia archaeon]|nr:hypothetical protein [Candidatus Nanoarchaeia archaeon]
MFNPNISVDDIVVLVVDKNHPRYGEIGKMLHHDWMDYGEITVKFEDGELEVFYDGIMKGDSPPKIRWFYRKDDH